MEEAPLQTCIHSTQTACLHCARCGGRWDSTFLHGICKPVVRDGKVPMHEMILGHGNGSEEGCGFNSLGGQGRLQARTKIRVCKE